MRMLRTVGLPLSVPVRVRLVVNDVLDQLAIETGLAVHFHNLPVLLFQDFARSNAATVSLLAGSFRPETGNRRRRVFVFHNLCHLRDNIRMGIGDVLFFS